MKYHQVSSMAKLPETVESTEILLSISSNDDEKGAGVKGVDLYVSIDNGPFILEQSGITGKNAIFTGKTGHKYGFYAIAKDNVGNSEAPKTEAETETTVYIPGVPSQILLEADTPSVIADGLSTCQITARVEDGKGKPVKDSDVVFTTSAGTLNSTSIKSDENGIAKVIFTSSDIPGKATVTAAVYDITTSVKIEQLSPVVLKELAVEPDTLSIDVGSTEKSVVSAVYSDGSSKIITDNIIYTSLDESIVIVDEKGNITGVGKGSTKIKVGYKDKTAEINVSIKPVPFTSEIKTGPTQTSIALHWDAVLGAVGYEVEADGKVTEVQDTGFLHSGLEPNAPHTYKVRARFVKGFSEWSDIKTVSTLSGVTYKISGRKGIYPENNQVKLFM